MVVVILEADIFKKTKNFRKNHGEGNSNEKGFVQGEPRGREKDESVFN